MHSFPSWINKSLVRKNPQHQGLQIQPQVGCMYQKLKDKEGPNPCLGLVGFLSSKEGSECWPPSHAIPGKIECFPK